MTRIEVDEAFANFEVTESAAEYIFALIQVHDANPSRNLKLANPITKAWLTTQAEEFTQANNVTVINVEAVRTYLKVKDILCPF